MITAMTTIETHDGISTHASAIILAPVNARTPAIP